MATGRQGTSRLMHSAAAPGLEAAHLTGPRAGPFGKQQQRHAVVEQAGGQSVSAAQAGPIDRERVEEQRGQTLAPPHVEEVVGRRASRDVARQLPGQRADDQRGVEMTGVIGHDDERAAHRVQVLPAEHRNADHPPDRRLENPSLRDESRPRMQRRGVAASARHGLTLSRPPVDSRLLGSRRASELGSRVSRHVRPNLGVDRGIGPGLPSLDGKRGVGGGGCRLESVPAGGDLARDGPHGAPGQLA